MPTDRPNTQLATFVDELATLPDKRAAAMQLYERGAGFSVICRVLAEPARRRAMAPKSEEELAFLGLFERLTPPRAR